MANSRSKSTEDDSRFSKIECLKNVHALHKSVFAKQVATTQKGRRKITSIYRKFKVGKENETSTAQKPRGAYCKYDKDGNANARFLETYLLMFKEGYNCSKASKKVVGASQHRAFRQAFGK